MSRITEKAPHVILTGATGFLGKYAAAEFLDKGYEVTGCGRNREALAGLAQNGLQPWQTSLTDMGDASRPADAVVHMAALSSPWGRPSTFKEHNIQGTRSVIQFCARNAIRRLVFVSTPSMCTTYSDRLGITEDNGPVAAPLNHYIASKIKAEALVCEAQQKGDIPEVVILRPRGLIGPGDPSLMPRLKKVNDRLGIPLFNNGVNLVDITCVENVAYSLRLAVESGQANGSYNITNGEPRPFRNLLQEYFDALGKSPRFRSGRFQPMLALAISLEKLYATLPGYPEPPLTRYTLATLAFSQTLDISKAVRDLGYTPKLSLSEGIKRYATWERKTHA